jgi:transcriptional regulator with XRE-family HTH domain
VSDRSAQGYLELGPNGHNFAPYPSEELIRRLAAALGADVDELLLLAKKIPADIRERVLQRPDAFRKLASLDDVALDEVIRQVDRCEPSLARELHERGFYFALKSSP